MIKVGIVGGTGYAGVELLRLLAQHPQVELRAVTSRKQAGTPVSAIFPALRRRVELAFVAPDAAALRGCDDRVPGTRSALVDHERGRGIPGPVSIQLPVEDHAGVPHDNV